MKRLLFGLLFVVAVLFGVTTTHAEEYNINYVTNGGSTLDTSMVPADYTPVEYIQTNGYSYIDTGVTGLNSGSWEIYAKWMLTRAPRVATSWIVGTYTTNENYNTYRITTAGQRADAVYLNGNSKASGGTAQTSAYPNQIHEGTIKNNSVDVDGRTYATTTKGTAIAATTPIGVFTRDAAGNNSGFYGRMYSTWAKQGGVLKYNYIPVRRNSDGVCGMWDTVSETFKPSTSSTNFTCSNTTVSTPDVYTGETGTSIVNGATSRFGTFAGWCTDAALTNCAMTQTIPANSTGEKTFYAKWVCNDGYHMDSETHECVPNVITLNFGNGGHGTVPESMTCEYGKIVTMPAAIEANGYNFSTWKVQSTNKFLKPETGYLCSFENFGVYSGTASVVANWFECMTQDENDECVDAKFSVTTTPLPADEDTTFSFNMSAKGTFYVDWGDGTPIETITRDAVTAAELYSHTYSPGGAAGDDPISYTIRFGGVATGYATKEAENSDLGAIDFYRGTPTLVQSISGGLGRLFPTLGSANGSQPRFYSAFRGCTNLTQIPEDLFDGISGTPATYMFYYTFSGTGITTVPEKLFWVLTGAPSTAVFWGTFCHNANLTTIPAGLFKTVTGAPVKDSWLTTFYNCSRLSAIPQGLFDNVSGAPGERAFQTTFWGCSSLTSIPEDLFAGVRGAPAKQMFYRTFYGCSGLTGSIPENLFSGIKGAPAQSMFQGTFYGCSGLTGSIPATLFSGISGAPAVSMFAETFQNCSGLTGSIPENLFSGIAGASATTMFQNAFNGAAQLTGYVSIKLFERISSGTSTNPMQNIFAGTGLDTTCPEGTQQYTTGWESAWSGKVACGPEVDTSEFGSEKFTVTVNMPANTAFKFTMSATGAFRVDWGDGTVQDLARASVTTGTYSHTYATAGEYNIKFYGTATGYSTVGTIPAISFFNGTRANHYSPITKVGTEQYITGISGSLGALFPTIENGTTNGQQPRFYQTFTGATNLTGSIPENLFSGIKGVPATYMFENLFSYCSGLTGQIPAGLFGGISGAPASNIFYMTFYGASGLVGTIPEGLFSGIKGKPASAMFYRTFSGCTGLTGTIPENLFDGIAGAPAQYMFDETFGNCSGLTGAIPAGLFSGVSGAPATCMFRNTFNGCSGLTGQIPATLFSGISGTRATYMFQQTFKGCSGLEEYIPWNLFLGTRLTGSAATSMFADTFTDTNLATTCPSGTKQSVANGFETYFTPYVACVPNTTIGDAKFTITTTELAAGDSFSFSTWANGTFWVDWGDETATRYVRTTMNNNAVTHSHTYANAGTYQIKLSGAATSYHGTNSASYPAVSFKNNTKVAAIDGNLMSVFPKLGTAVAAIPRFRGTFSGCTNLTGGLPVGLFGETTFTPGANMFDSMFSGTTGLTDKYIPYNIFASVSGTASGYMSNIFADSGLLTACPTGTKQYITGLEANWSGKVMCITDEQIQGLNMGNEKFGVTTINMDAGTVFSFDMTAIGNFWVDWGDNSIQKITRTNTTKTTYSHTYASAGTHNIKFYGLATGYSTTLTNNTTAAAIGFPSNTNVAGISGSLGALFPTIENGATNGQQPRFFSTFYNNTNLTGPIPAGLFSGITGQPASHMFRSTFNGCSSLSGQIPATLFSGISGQPAEYVFSGTFSGCSSLSGQIPATLFSGISGAPAQYMFNATFNGCAGLVGTIPATLFSGVRGAASTSAFASTFAGCSQLESYVPKELFAGITSVGSNSMPNVFNGSGLLTECPSGTTQYITGFESYWSSKVACVEITPISEMGDAKFTVTTTNMAAETTFNFTFAAAGEFAVDCGNEIDGNPQYIYIVGDTATQGTYACEYPEGGVHQIKFYGLATKYSTNTNTAAVSFASNPNVAGISGSLGALFPTIGNGTTNGQQPRFYRTFYNNTNLTGQIPAGLFNGITGQPASNMFDSTFSGCSGLTGEIPAGLFSGISGAPTSYMYYQTFYGCTGLTGAIPDRFFGDLSGSMSSYSYSFYQTFYNDSRLTGYVPADLFDGLSYANASTYSTYYILNDIFYGTGLATSCSTGTKQYITGFESYWSSKVACITDQEYADLQTQYGEPKFTVTTTSLSYNNREFSFSLSAKGDFWVDWGDSFQRIVRNDTTQTTYSHTYTSNGVKTIKFGGLATGYNTYSSIGSSYAPIAFSNNTKVARVSGSLGAMFPTLSGDSSYATNPRFMSTFYGNTNLVEIPATLFSGVTRPYNYMFYQTFYGCSKLTSIPVGLFDTIQGAPASNMFDSTFSGCSGLTGEIPAGLFSGISGAPASNMFDSTFSGCSGLSGQIPATLFSGISGAPASGMFYQTFYNCRGLSGQIPATLFSGISGAPASHMFDGTFSGCSDLSGEIPATLFSGISGAPASHMFSSTFSGCTGLQSLPATLFSGVSGAPKEYMFDSTFSGCSGLSGAIPATLFSGISGAPAQYMFQSTFYGCSGLSGEIPATLFSRISGAPAPSMYYRTFYGCTALTGSIPDRFFGDLSGTLSYNSYAFYQTFYNDSGLTGYVPVDLFTGLSYANTSTDYILNDIFYGTRLETSCPSDKVQYITGFENYFNSKVACTEPYITPIILNSGDATTVPEPTTIYEQYGVGYYSDANKTTEITKLTTLPTKSGKVFNGYWTGEGGSGTKAIDLDGTLLVDTRMALPDTENITLYADWVDSYTVTYSCGEGTGTPPAPQTATQKWTFILPKNACEREGYLIEGWTVSGSDDIIYDDFVWNYDENKTFTARYSQAKFMIRTTNMAANTTFSFTMSALGNFTVDWGDGSDVQTINRTSTSFSTYSHKYTTAGSYIIKFNGLATGYNTNSYNGYSYAPIAFRDNKYIAQLFGSLGAIFPTLSGDSSYATNPRFMETFRTNTNLSTIPATLFSGVTRPYNYMFYRTFSGCSKLTSIPVGLFDTIQGAPAQYMFSNTFSACAGLQSLPATLFGGISGAPASGMFSNTFGDCSGLTGEIPATLFSGISGAPASSMFYQTFSGCSGLSGEIPATLFSGISGAPASSMFSNTFGGCSGLSGEIPATLFSGISGAPAQYMFQSTFSGCSSLSGEIPATLFSGISGAPAQYMFSNTFGGCSGLSGEIPATLFSGIRGAPTQYMFQSTFYGCSGLSGEIPATLFSGISGAPTSYMYYQTFYGCTGLTGAIPDRFFGDLSGSMSSYSYSFYQTFYNDSGLTGYVPANLFDGLSYTNSSTTYILNGIFYGTGLSTSCPMGTKQYITGFEDYWDSKVACMTDQEYADLQSEYGAPKFTVTTTELTADTTFSFTMSAAGDFTVDWDDGSIQRITRTNTNYLTYSHTYTTAGTYNIKFYGLATGYNTSSSNSSSYAPIAFSNNTKVARVSGSLGAMFPTLSGDSSYATNPRFIGTFSGNTNLTEIPSTLFSGVTRPYSYMFYNTFYGCSKLTSIPVGLFDTIQGAPAYYMFYGTFNGCSGLQSLPTTLFSGISGAPAQYMFGNTFSGCTGLQSLPATLFSGISGAPASYMYYQTFYGCSGLTGSIPSNFFGNLSGTLSSGVYAFYQTFYNDSGLTGYVPMDLFEGLNYVNSSSTNNILNGIFYGTGLETSCPSNMQQYFTGFEDYFDGKVACTNAKPISEMGDVKFTITTTDMSTNSSFSVNISAAGEFAIDCGNEIDGEPQYIYIADGRTTQRTYYCKYPDAGSYQIKLYGTATGYDTNTYNYSYQYKPTIAFGNKGTIAGIDGSLGALFPTIGDGSTNGQQPRFYSTFSGASNMTGTIPENLFSGIHGAPTESMFYNTFSGCSGLTGSIPENLFSGITGTFPDSNGYYFSNTFYGCSGLGGYIPPRLFRFPTTNVNWNNMGSIFNGANGLLTKCPAGTKKYTTGFENYWYLGTGNKYAISCEPGISDDDAMFAVYSEINENDTFEFDMSAAGTFFVDWGDGTIDKIERDNTTPATYSHTYTDSDGYEIRFVNDGVTAYSDGITTPAISFAGNTQIGAIDGSLAELFPTITVLNKQQQPRFYQTFKDCTNLEYFSDKLFARINNSYHNDNPIITGQPVSHMFEGLFQGCTALQTEIPGNLFANVSGVPTIGLFAHTFEGCSGLTGEIPEYMFENIIGAPAISMFDSTFKGCSGLSGEIPEYLFAGIDGAPAERMFYATFDGCENLVGFIYPKTFEHISHVNVSNMMTNIFNNTGLDTVCPDKLNQYITGFEEWFGGKVSCDASSISDMSYDVFSTYLGYVEADATFSFSLSAKGDFYVDWGDGTTQEITRDDTTPTTYSHTYNAGGYYTVRFGSAVTGYSTDETTPAISFEYASNMVGIEMVRPQGYLMDLFPILGDANGQIPRFYHTFRGLNNLYSFDDSLFSSNKIRVNSISELPNWSFASHMFDGMFENCVNLFDNDYNGSDESSEHFEQLFAFFGGTPAPYTFANMFRGTTNTMGYISPTMFNKITASGQNMMQNIFADSGLDTVCPKGTWNYTTGFESNWSGHVACEYFDELPSIDLQTIGLNSDSVFEFSMSATGRFAIDWGDNSDLQIIERNNTTPTTYSHTYSEPNGNSYYVRIYGIATGYSTGEATAAISFANNDLIQYVGNSNHADFGSMFPTIGDGSTNGQQPRFYRTFYNCTNLENFNGSFTGNSDWEGKSSGIHGAPASHMFDGLFENCSNLNTPSSDIFGYTENNFYGTTMAPQYGIFGAPSPYVFANTFKNTGINSFYPTWFAGLVGAPAAHMFDGTFDGANDLYINFRSGNSNNNIFKNITGAPAPYMFANTFRGTNTQGSPDDLFSSISGAPSEGMFMGTFANTSLNYIPEDLFVGINGAPAAHMFENTFNGCGNLNNDYLSPALFVGVTGPAAPYMFAGTFAGANIGGNLPTMFAGITGSAEGMFMETFAGTSNLIGYIQPNMFVGVSGTATDMMTDIFTDSSLVTECPDGTTQYTTGFESWFDGHVACISTADEFEVRAGVFTTSMPAGATFSFTMSARGTFYVDWGDESQVETITRNNTTPTVYSHTYTESTDDAGVEGWEISFGGIATGYSTDETTAAISFANNQYVSGVVNLGHMFPTLGAGNGLQPRFYQTFKNCVNLQGDISEMLTFCKSPEVSGGDINYDGGHNVEYSAASNLKRGATARVATAATTRSASVKRRQTTYNNQFDTTCTGIFDGIYGQPVSHMFDGTFEGCTGLTGQIPASLFITISGVPVPYVFANTFKNCTGISGAIPSQLFSGISGAPAPHMFESTFENDTGLTGTIPGNLFTTLTARSSVSNYGDYNGGSVLKKATVLKRGATTRGAVRTMGATTSNLRRETVVPEESTDSGTLTISESTFDGINGAPAAYMFANTFKGCSNLTGEIPAGLFAGISGAPAEYMFSETFAGCSGLESVPGCLFGGISGAPAAGMYIGTFDGCRNAEWNYTPVATNTGSVNAPIYGGDPVLAAASNLKRSAATRGAVAGTTLGKINTGTTKVNTLRDAVMGGLTRGALRRNSSLRATNTTDATNANAMPSLFGQFTGAAATNMFKNTFRGCTKLSGYVPPKMFDGITGTASDMMTDEFENSGIATSCPAGYKVANTGFESWWDGRVACEYVGQICVYDENATDPYKCADGCSWTSKLMMHNESWNEFGGFPGYPLLSENVTEHAINISNGATTCYLPIGENSDWGLHLRWDDKIWHALFGQSDAQEANTWGYCDGTYATAATGSCSVDSDCAYLYDDYNSWLMPSCFHGTCALYQDYGNCYYLNGNTSNNCVSDYDYYSE